MNPWIDASSPTVHYYDSDYPSERYGPHPENFDDVTVFQGLRHDVDRYLEIARECGGPVLEPCCGTGRVAFPLAAAGLDVTGVDVSPGLLRILERKRESLALPGRVEIVQDDVTAMALPRRDFRLAILAFNSLLCLTSFDDQRAALATIARHLAPGGLLVLDIVNPLQLALGGNPTPQPFFTRRDPVHGRRYTRFAASKPIDRDHCQELWGWYDEIDEAGIVRRRPYSVTWRPIFRFEIELMLNEAGFGIVAIEGGHRREPYLAGSPRMFIQARRRDGEGARDR